jgi:hypothetical protein
MSSRAARYEFQAKSSIEIEAFHEIILGSSDEGGTHDRCYGCPRAIFLDSDTQ